MGPHTWRAPPLPPRERPTAKVAIVAPLVFFVLPLTVVFAVYPGLAVLELGF
ncbi:hypothetical protein [Kocuria arenosa]|uniref:hypothetical protein n=1 Tax=Kocuria arenosa TaxID=3071446 RepID=UPI0034D3B797